MTLNRKDEGMSTATVRMYGKVIRNCTINYLPKTPIIHVSQGIAMHI